MIGHNMLAGEKPPVEPIAALAHTQDGAVAFAQFWIQTLDWGYATTSTVYARHYIDPICTNCSELLSQIDQVASLGQHYLGDRVTVTSASVKNTALDNGAEYTVVVITDITGAQIVDGSRKFVSGNPAITGRPLSVLPKWSEKGWLVADVGGA